MRIWTLLGTLVLAACDPVAADVATLEPDEVMDIRGTYALTVSEVEGCGASGETLSWIGDTLVIGGTPADLEFDFGGGAVLDGTVDTAFAVDADGVVDVGEGTHDVVYVGVALLGDDGWELDADVAVDVRQSTGADISCTLQARLGALQDPGPDD